MKGPKSGQMEVSMSGNGKTTKLTEEESYTIQMATYTKEIG